METLLVFKQQLIRFYAKVEAFVIPILKFFAMLVALIYINSNIGFMAKLKNPAIVLIISLLCSFLPANVIVLLAGLVIVAHVYALSLECAVVVLFVFIIMYALYFRFTPGDAIAVILTPVACAMKIPYIIPISMGFLGNPLSCISVGCGTVVYYMISYLKKNSDSLKSSGTGIDAESALSGFKTAIDGLLKNDTMIVMIITFSAMIIVVYLIRRLRINYSWQIALGLGSIVGFITLIVSNSVLDADASIGMAILGIIISDLLGIVLTFFVFNVDYSRAEHVQFEDDEYYYYVKAIPKVVADERMTRSRRRSRDWDDEDEDDY